MPRAPRHFLDVIETGAMAQEIVDKLLAVIQRLLAWSMAAVARRVPWGS